MSKKIIAIHNGSFHADDVFSVALAQHIFGVKNVSYERVANPTEKEADAFWSKFDYVVDAGRRCDMDKFFDHHQDGAPVHEDGTKHCGLTLFAQTMLSPELFNELWKLGFRAIAAGDNGQTPKASDPRVGGWVNALTPVWDEPSPNYDAAFAQAVAIALPILEGMIAKAEAALRAQADYRAAATRVSGGRILVLDHYVDFGVVLSENADTEALFVVFPSNRGGYCVQCIPPDADHPFEQRMSLPEEWVKAGPVGCSFTHVGRWLASFDTETNAVAALKSIL